MPETHDYRCTVTLLLEDVTEETARQFFQDGGEVEGCPPVDGFIAFIESPGKVELVRSCPTT